ncbi:hypothetical protein MP228_011818 [Amoeboaphelidium protococcarum]|nr:hypothetical protein MP228_011818 [Amoeboaphelidium protococcarum]
MTQEVETIFDRAFEQLQDMFLDAPPFVIRDAVSRYMQRKNVQQKNDDGNSLNTMMEDLAEELLGLKGKYPVKGASGHDQEFAIYSQSSSSSKFGNGSNNNSIVLKFAERHPLQDVNGDFETVHAERSAKLTAAYKNQALIVVSLLFLKAPLQYLRNQLSAQKNLFVPAYVAIYQHWDGIKDQLDMKQIKEYKQKAEFITTKLPFKLNKNSRTFPRYIDPATQRPMCVFKACQKHIESTGHTIDLYLQKELDYLANNYIHLNFDLLCPSDGSAQDVLSLQQQDLMECSCCFGEKLFSGMIACTEGHLFCGDCGKRVLEEAVGNRKTELNCIAASFSDSKLTSSAQNSSAKAPANGLCPGHFLLKELSTLVDNKVVENYHRLVQEIEIKQALQPLSNMRNNDQTSIEDDGDDNGNVDGDGQKGADNQDDVMVDKEVIRDYEELVQCPFCDFAALMTSKAEVDKLFRCLNPKCFKMSCRLCGKESHIPKSCKEVEAESSVTNFQHKVAEAMTDALIRECPKCHKKFFKEEGCNKMTCSCGTKICYICRRVVKGYDHFGSGNGKDGKCPLWDDTVQKNAQEVLKAAEEAAKELEKTKQVNDDTLVQFNAERDKLEADLRKQAQKKAAPKYAAPAVHNIAHNPYPQIAGDGLYIPPAVMRYNNQNLNRQNQHQHRRRGRYQNHGQAARQYNQQQQHQQQVQRQQQQLQQQQRLQQQQQQQLRQQQQQRQLLQEQQQQRLRQQQQNRQQQAAPNQRQVPAAAQLQPPRNAIVPADHRQNHNVLGTNNNNAQNNNVVVLPQNVYKRIPTIVIDDDDDDDDRFRPVASSTSNAKKKSKVIEIMD